MGGIISGFLTGAGNAAYDLGKMQFADNLQSERDEADFLRDKALQKSGQDFSRGEREAGQDFTSSERQASDAQQLGRDDRSEKFRTGERVAGEVESAKEGDLDRKSREGIAKYAVDNKAKKNPQTIKYTDSKGYEQEGVLHDNGDGTYNIVKPGTTEVLEENITTEQLKNKAAQMNAASGKGDDWIPWNEVGYKDDAVRAAVVEDQKSDAKPVGIVNSQKDAKPAAGKPAPAPKSRSGDPQKDFDKMKSTIKNFDESKAIEAIRKQYGKADWSPKKDVAEVTSINAGVVDKPKVKEADKKPIESGRVNRSEKPEPKAKKKVPTMTSAVAGPTKKKLTELKSELAAIPEGKYQNERKRARLKKEIAALEKLLK